MNTINQFTTVSTTLLARTKASRSTIRMCHTDGSTPLVAEALAPGVISMTTIPVQGISDAPTYLYLAEHHCLLVQSNTRIDPVAPPLSLIEVFDVCAQMLAPVVIDNEMVATISVHQQAHPRDWSPDDLAAIEWAQSVVREIIQSSEQW